MNNYNNTDNRDNARRLITSQRDFNRYTQEHANNIYSSKLRQLLSNKSNILAGSIISLTLLWIFLGQHNNKNQLIPQASAPVETLDTQDISSNQQISNIEIHKNNNKYKSQQIELPLLPVHDAKQTEQQDLISPSNKTNNLITKTIIVKKNDNLTNIFNKLKINKEDLYKIINNKITNSYIKKIKPGQELTISYDKSSGKLQQLTYALDKLNIFSIKQDPKNSEKIIGKEEKLDVTPKETFAILQIKSSLFEDAAKQDLPMDIVFQIMDIFAWDIDFAQDLRVGDTVEILYRDYLLDGEKHSTGPVLAVNFHNNNKTYSAIRHEHDGEANYYTPEGLSLRKAFIRTPVKFTRISSKFNLGRNHPLLHKIRAHRGVDYAAPTGTPIKAAGDGKIIHYGRKGGYGKAVVIEHGRKYTTLYAHMSRYNSKLRRGSQVKQGQIIGYVGSTGLATGPHLHFEFRVDGEHKNPLTVPLPKAKPIENKHKIQYIDNANKLLAKLQRYKSLTEDKATMMAANTHFE